MTSDSRHQLGASGVDRRPVRGERCQRSLLDRREDLAGHLNELVADRQRRVWCPEGANIMMASTASRYARKSSRVRRLRSAADRMS